MGGKSRIRDQIISMIPAHKTYIEPFGGACWVLFGKPPSPIEFINDIDNELINLYLVIQNDLDKFIETLNNMPISEYLFNKVVDHNGIPTAPDNKVYRACSTYYLIMNAFNGKIAGKPVFAFSNDKESAFMKFYNTDWDGVRERLKRVTILNRDFADIIKKLDGPDVIFYLDPPYVCATDNTRYYRYTFRGSEHEEMKVYLEDITGKFILSYQDNKKIRDLYSDYNVVEVEGIPHSSGEILITNFEVPKVPFYTCRKGIPSAGRGIPRRSAYYIPNCPYCESRNVKQLWERITKPDGKRNWVPNGFICKYCQELIRMVV